MGALFTSKQFSLCPSLLGSVLKRVVASLSRPYMLLATRFSAALAKPRAASPRLPIKFGLTRLISFIAAREVPSRVLPLSASSIMLLVSAEPSPHKLGKAWPGV